jgi:hypothetical protein
MTQGFEHQEPMTNFAFSRTASQPQQVGVRLKLDDKKKPAEPAPETQKERRSF